ncbi:hypothetical protein GALL_233420 [mine drainage metagenome]|uniref:Uncharacterized protein n=1 Tax=mine drainage metagenome TaxID=410659 RepID=A0A1J5RRG7_9ZZZZ
MSSSRASRYSAGESARSGEHVVRVSVSTTGLEGQSQGVAALLDAPELTLNAKECDDTLGDIDGWDDGTYAAAEEELRSGESGLIAIRLGLADLSRPRGSFDAPPVPVVAVGEPGRRSRSASCRVSAPPRRPHGPRRRCVHARTPHDRWTAPTRGSRWPHRWRGRTSGDHGSRCG